CDRIAYDVVGRFENFAADFRTILLRLGVTEDVLALAGEVTNPTPDFPLAVAYDTELAKVVYDYYREDFERFGYARDSWITPR
ncbi:MAG TPA: sulfotransferase family 2 domain-containing protein, partial [Acidimicrobiales bacterium]|nr:sulfotransferase family 2 domain-containing protein [Acidimicrobiales bacterium]